LIKTLHVKTAHFFIFSFIVLCLSACASSPTGRSQLILVSDAQMDQMGRDAFADMKQSETPQKSGRNITYVRCIADAILRSDNRDPNAWEVQVFDNQTPNAFALPGKKIGVHVGMIKLAKTADQLAAVIGHEIGHVDARHGAERASLSMTSQLAQQVTAVALNGQAYQGEALAALGLGAQYGLLLPFSRTHESEADTIGLYLMAKAGFNPKEAVALWQTMKQASGGKAPPEFMSTHPSNDTRIKDIRADLAQVMPIYQKAKTNDKNPSCKRPNL
jgi:predicted Zn-dependent protease